MFFNNEWGEICYQRNSTVLSIVCAQLGYGSAGAVPFSTSISRIAPIWLDNDIECVGDEDTIFDCPSLEFTDIGKVVGGYCDDGAAGVVCPLGRLNHLKCSFSFDNVKVTNHLFVPNTANSYDIKSKV